MGSPTRPYRGISATDRTARRRADLKAAAFDLLGTVGWEQATMTAICARAKLTERYFYESFAGRDELLITVFDELGDRIRAEVIAALDAAPPEPEATARAAITVFVDLLTDDPRNGRVAIVEANATALLRQRRHQVLGEFADLIVTRGRALFGADALPAPRDRINALLFTGGLAEVLTAWLAGEVTASKTDIIETAVNQFTRTAHR
ncbi:MAG TPA: TetR family transcriptional regulator [Pseudonocardiaceae bacterium]